MPERVVFPQFRDETLPTRYPFIDDADLTASSGDLAIEVDTFIDASLYPIGSTVRLYISKIIVTQRKVTIWIGDALRSELASCSFDPVLAPDILALEDEFERPAGVLISESARLMIFGTWPVGEHRFDRASTEFVSSVTIPMPNTGLIGLQLPAGDILTGDIWLVGDDGIIIRSEDGVIRIDAVGDPLFRRHLCDPHSIAGDLFNTPNFVRTINGCTPDEFGRYQIILGGEVSDSVLRIYEADGAIFVGVAAGHLGDG